MRGKILVVGLVVAIGMGAAGCKSGPNLAWWKKANNSEAESAVLAAAEPQLPSAVAKQAENIAAVGGQAAPFVPTVASAAPVFVPSASTASPYPTTYPATSYPATSYPATGAAPSMPRIASTAPIASPIRSSTTPNPYDPNAVPAAAPVIAASAPVSAVAAPAIDTTDRYGLAASNVVSPSLPAAVPTLPSAPSTERYSSLPPGSSNPALPQAAPPLAAVGAKPDTLTASAVDRYAQTTTPTVEPTAATYPMGQQTIVPTSSMRSDSSVVAEANRYRPGGTSSYPGTTAAPPSIEVATRPPEPRSLVPPQPSVPNVTTPADSTSTPRYW